MYNKRRAYAEKREAQLNEWSAQLELLKAKAVVAKADLKIEYGDTINLLQHRAEEAKDGLQALRSAGDEAWGDLKGGMERMFSEGRTAYHQALSRFK